MPFGTLTDFHEITARLNEKWVADDEPIICKLLEKKTEKIQIIGETEPRYHSAEACNIADMMASIIVLVGLPKTDSDCRLLQITIIVQCEILRSAIQKLISSSQTYKRTNSENIIAAWANYLKHPETIIFTHQCFDDTEVHNFIKINNQFILDFNKLENTEKREKRNQMKGKNLVQELPSKDDLMDFVEDEAKRIKTHIGNKVP